MKDFKEWAKEYGFADGILTDARGLIPEGTKERACLLLFRTYGCARAEGEDLPVSGYYPASNAGYHDAKALAKQLTEAGIPARMVTDLPVRKLALRCGGALGRNGLYYHPDLGSLTFIATLLLDVDPPEILGRGTVHAFCARCGKCLEACPTDALKRGDMTQCLREKMRQNPIPEDARGKIYQLFGCELCQNGCPLNQKVWEKGLSYPLGALLDRSALPDLKQQIGPNTARLGILLRQTLCLAANRGLVKTLELKACWEDEPLCAEEGAYAREKLEKLQKENPL